MVPADANMSIISQAQINPPLIYLNVLLNELVTGKLSRFDFGMVQYHVAKAPASTISTKAYKKNMPQYVPKMLKPANRYYYYLSGKLVCCELTMQNVNNYRLLDALVLASCGAGLLGVRVFEAISHENYRVAFGVVLK